MGSSTAVIDPRFCFPGEIHLTIVKKIMPISAGNFRVINDKGDIMFNVKERLLSFHSRHVLLDAAGNTIATLKKKIFGVYQRWQVYKRDSSDLDDVVSVLPNSGLVQKKHRFGCVMKRRDTLSVTMSPNVDHSFVVGLVVILDRINDGMDDLITSCIWIEI